MSIEQKHQKKRSELLKVIENRKINSDYYILEVESTESTSGILPGQFVEILVKNTRNAFLRRPISIYDVNPERNSFELLIQIIGEGTQLLSELKSGDSVDIMFPLGKSFTMSNEGQRVLLVGGGVGVAPLLYLSKKLKEKGVNSHILLGGRGTDNIIEVDNFKKYSTVHISTDDGSIGEKGFVTQHSVMQNMDFDMIYSCGPDPMMRAVAKLANEQNVNCEVSLENMMACGIGACLCCVTETTSGHQCVCTDGPVFNIKVLDWK